MFSPTMNIKVKVKGLWKVVLLSTFLTILNVALWLGMFAGAAFVVRLLFF